MKIFKVFVITFALLIFNLPCFAKEINFEATVDRNKVALGQPVQLDLTFVGTQDIPALQLPEVDGFQSRYVGPSTRMSIVNGRVSSWITHVYTLLPLKLGKFKVGPLKFDYKGNSYVSNVIDIEVVQGQPQPGYAQPEQEAMPEQKDLQDRVFVTMQSGKNRLYLNEVTPLTIKLYVNKLGIRDIQFPEFNHEGFSLGEFQQPKQYQEVFKGINYDVIEFTVSLFGVRTGEFKIGPARIKCNLIVRKEGRKQGVPGFEDFFNTDIFEGFFGRYETYPLELTSADMPITVLPLPEENKPAGFTGAVGKFSLEANIQPQEVKVGDPITLKVAVGGEGNFNTVTMPKLNAGDNFKVYEPQVKQRKDTKVFEQILMPMREGAAEIPAVNFSFFNTETERYQTLTSGPFSVKVSKLEKQEEQRIIEPQQVTTATAKEEKLGRDIIYIKTELGHLRTSGDYLYRRRIFLWMQILPALIFCMLFAFYRWQTKLKADVKFARQLQAPRKAKAGMAKAKKYLASAQTKEFYDTIFLTLQEYLGDKFHLPSKGITAGIIDDALKDKGVAVDIQDKLRDIFRECDLARFAPAEIHKEEMQKSLVKLEEIISYFQRNKL